MVDRAAKEATKHGVVDLGIGFCQTEIKSMVRQEMKKRGQKQWEEEKRGRDWMKSKGGKEK